jgi:hypothetical protein
MLVVENVSQSALIVLILLDKYVKHVPPGSFSEMMEDVLFKIQDVINMLMDFVSNVDLLL